MIKPEFFDDPSIGELTPLARLFFIGLWTQADREGRLVDDVRRLKVRIFPYDDVDVEVLAGELHGRDMIRRYSDENGHGYIWIRSFTKHQRPHPKEPASLIPECTSRAVIKHGKPCKKTTSPQSNGTRNLDSGTRKLDPCTTGADAPTQVVDPDLLSETETVSNAETAAFVKRFCELYRQHRHGARYVVKRAKDIPQVKALLQVFGPERLERVATVLLTTDEEWIEHTDRGIGILSVKASWCDGMLAEYEAEHGLKVQHG